ncbi:MULTISPECIES: TetR/AcrR family transcriptional regulator [unclassified Nocardiopsis]|uniref:TetR/AcrR family transcriptional regulator n=1 Tax=Nocardiopsis TaxID=2013 RepID=UPI00387AF914
MTERRKQVIRLQIARAALELFAEQGVAGTTGDDIAHAIGISTRTLWRYFPTKEGCVRPLLTSGLEVMAAHLRGWPADLSLVDHLDRVGAFTGGGGDGEAGGDGEGGDTVEAPVAALIRMTRTEPGLMAVWLDVHRAAEDVFAQILAERLGVDPGDFAVRVRSAALNGALRAAAERQALHGGASGDGSGGGSGVDNGGGTGGENSGGSPGTGALLRVALVALTDGFGPVRSGGGS